MGYQESLIYIQPQEQVGQIVKEYLMARQQAPSGRFLADIPAAVRLQAPLKGCPAGSVLLWAAGERSSDMQMCIRDRAERMIQNVGCHYVIDIDIHSFFDNVNHGKLLKQMWALGIRDKKLLSITSAMLKAEVAGIGFPEKGTPQGGIISPLLSNIVLNELDWWIVSQWEEMPTKRNYVHRVYANGTPDKSSTIRTLRGYTNLKECYVVRYADDFKIFCKKRSDAVKLFEATKLWLNERLGLEISPEKSKIVNLKRHYSEFLGFKLKVREKGKKPDGQPRFVIEAHIKDKALLKIRDKSKAIIGQLRQTYNQSMEYRLIQKYNSYLIGVHNYYSIATHVNIDIHEIAFDVKKSLYNRLKHRLQKKGKITNRYIKEKYGTSREVRYLNGHAVVPIAYVQHRAVSYTHLNRAFRHGASCFFVSG